MSRKIRLKRGNLADLPQLELGEPGVATDDGSLYIGTDRGNVRLANQDDLDGVNQQLADKVAGRINVTEFGVQGDGTDETSKVQNAIDFAELNNLKLVFPSDKKINVKSLTSSGLLSIEGNGSTLKQHEEGTGYFLKVNGNNAIVTGLNLESIPGTNMSGIEFSGNNINFTGNINGFRYSCNITGDNATVDLTVHNSTYASCRLSSLSATNKIKRFTINRLESYNSKVKGFVCNGESVEEIYINRFFATTNSTEDASDGIDVNANSIDRIIINHVHSEGAQSNSMKFYNTKLVEVGTAILRNKNSSYSASSAMRFFGNGEFRAKNLTVDNLVSFEGDAFIDNIIIESTTLVSQLISLKGSGKQFTAGKIDATNLTADAVIRVDRSVDHKIEIGNLLSNIKLFSVFQPVSPGNIILKNTSYTGSYTGRDTYNREIIQQPRFFQSTVIPSSGNWVKGDVVINTGTDNTILLWKRMTTGSENVSGTDWKPVTF